MSDRANGWLLILGGLAIGLTLWLSPSEETSSSEFEKVRWSLQGQLKEAVLRWDIANTRTAPKIYKGCIAERSRHASRRQAAEGRW